MTTGAACENTTASHESPVEIDTRDLMAGRAEQRVVPHFAAAKFDVENNGHTIEAVPEDVRASSVGLDGKTYYLQQFHFHATSEHVVDGESAPAELHLVNKADDGEILVLGVLLKTGPASSALDELFSSIPVGISQQGTPLKRSIDPAALVPTKGVSVQYDGSLTTPPCTEGVRWNVYLTPVTVSATELEAYTDIYPDNHRPLQPLNGRVLSEIPAGS